MSAAASQTRAPSIASLGAAAPAGWLAASAGGGAAASRRPRGPPAPPMTAPPRPPAPPPPPVDELRHVHRGGARLQRRRLLNPVEVAVDVEGSDAQRQRH